MDDQPSADRNPRNVFKVGIGTSHTAMDAQTAHLHHRAGDNGAAAIIPSAGTTPEAERDAMDSSPDLRNPPPEDWETALRLVDWYLGSVRCPGSSAGAATVGPTEGHVAIVRGRDER